MNTPLSDNQEAVLAFMLRYRDEVGRPATTREIQHGLSFSSQNSVMRCLRSLMKRGLVDQPNDGRTWVPKRTDTQTHLPLIPLYGTIPAGIAVANPEEADQHVRIDPLAFGLRTTHGLFALKVRGDSMIGAQIADGDIALLRDQPAKIGDIIAALIDGESTLKRYMKDRGKPVLRAENPKYRDIIPAQDLTSQGVLVGVIGRGKR